MNIINLAKKLRPIIEQAVQSVSDETALEAVSLFPQWKEDEYYTAGQRVRYEGVLYSVLQNHTSQINWTPTTAVSLFTKVLIPDANIVPEWEQPSSTNGYSINDRVMFKGVVYESIINNNVWSPSAYPAGWKVIENK